MTEASLTSLIEDTLKIPVYLGSQSIILPAATLEITGYPSVLAGDGKSVLREEEAVINLWYVTKTERDEAQTSLLTALAGKNGLSIPECETYYDTTAKKFRAVISFNYIATIKSINDDSKIFIAFILT